MKTERLIQLSNILNENLEKLNKAALRLDSSYSNILNFGIKSDYSEKELEQLESFASRFSRLSDILTQKVLKSFFILLQEDFRSFLDMAELAEKYEIVENFDILILIRDFRNQIAHEYIDEELYLLYEELIKSTPILLGVINTAINIIDSHLKRLIK